MKTYVMYNPYYDRFYFLKAKELEYWDDFNSALVLIGEL